MERIKTSGKTKCAASLYCFPLNGKMAMRHKWVDKHDLFLDEDGRVFALVDSADTVYFMDAITGSLYQFGNCLTSNILKAVNMKRSDKAKEVLLSMKAAAEPDEMDIAA